MMDDKYFLGFDIGGSKIAVCVGNSRGQILAADRVEGGTSEPYTVVLPRLLALGDELIRQAGLKPRQIHSCGISAPGPLDIASGSICKSPNMVWADVPIRQDIGDHFGVPAILENDGNAGALVEWFFGAAKGCRNFIYFTMSTGIGAGIVTDGTLVRGKSGNAGELGHAILDLNGPVCGCGMRGCFEAFCSGRNVAEQLRRMVANDPEHPLLKMPQVNGDATKLNFQVLREAVKNNVPEAVEFWDQLCLRLAQGIGLYIMVFNPELIILGTLFIYSGDLLLDPVRRYLPRFAWQQLRQDCRIVTPALGKEIGELAGICVALYDLYQKDQWQPPTA